MFDGLFVESIVVESIEFFPLGLLVPNFCWFFYVAKLVEFEPMTSFQALAMFDNLKVCFRHGIDRILDAWPAL